MIDDDIQQTEVEGGGASGPRPSHGIPALLLLMAEQLAAMAVELRATALGAPSPERMIVGHSRLPRPLTPDEWRAMVHWPPPPELVVPPELEPPAAPLASTLELLSTSIEKRTSAPPPPPPMPPQEPPTLRGLPLPPPEPPATGTPSGLPCILPKLPPVPAPAPTAPLVP